MILPCNPATKPIVILAYARIYAKNNVPLLKMDTGIRRHDGVLLYAFPHGSGGNKAKINHREHRVHRGKEENFYCF